jgi:hypothetical protein
VVVVHFINTNVGHILYGTGHRLVCCYGLCILFTINVLVLAVADFVTLEKIPKWFLYTIVTAAIIFGTMANISIISDNDITVLIQNSPLDFYSNGICDGLLEGIKNKEYCLFGSNITKYYIHYFILVSVLS